MVAPSTLLLAPPPRHQRRCLLATAALLLSLLLASPLTLAVTPARGKSIRPLHRDGYEHLDCSACITIAGTLFRRLNQTLSDKPSTYLISHRLSKEKQLRWRRYRNSELLVTDVMDDVCTSYKNDLRLLRMHPKSKVRLYHQQSFGDARIAIRHALREDEVYPIDADPAAWAEKQDGSLYPIATLYSPRDADKLHGSQSLSVATAMCALLVDEFEEEIEELVKTARSQAEMEYSLCGMALPLSRAGPTLDGDATESEASSVPLITNVCADVEVLRAAARRDQQRWEQYQRRTARRKADVARMRGLSTAATAASESAEDGAAHGEAAAAVANRARAAPGEPADSTAGEALDSSFAEASANAVDGHADFDL
ncbi:hypothetical protein LSCM4_02882 [Leishmania orientalis]|uniref:DUF3456 domain-containing protein n=1 Tax=Leishmania orientalis TaxID=2249476 RepID=A0A836H542_9TRYP|nr:hypothetical protein LSCM4_02882 [Leishmania orientalis]